MSSNFLQLCTLVNDRKRITRQDFFRFCYPRNDDWLKKHFEFFKNNLQHSPVLELLPYLPHYLINDPIGVTELSNVFKIEHCLEYLLLCLRETINSQYYQPYFCKCLFQPSKVINVCFFFCFCISYNTHVFYIQEKLIVLHQYSIKRFMEEKNK